MNDLICFANELRNLITDLAVMERCFLYSSVTIGFSHTLSIADKDPLMSSKLRITRDRFFIRLLFVVFIYK